jgi:hypothetical protein
MERAAGPWRRVICAEQPRRDAAAAIAAMAAISRYEPP